MARKKAKKEVSRKEINGNIIITFDDGSIQIIPAPIELSSEEASSIFGSSEEEEEEDEMSGEQLNDMVFEELEDIVDDKDLEVDPDDYEEEDIKKLRKAIAKELGITLPKKEKAKGKKGKK